MVQKWTQISSSQFLIHESKSIRVYLLLMIYSTLICSLTLTEKMFPVCPVCMVATGFLLYGFQMITETSSEPDARRLKGVGGGWKTKIQC